jgi:hypothetical protein
MGLLSLKGLDIRISGVPVEIRTERLSKSPVDTICTTCFNIPKLCILPTATVSLNSIKWLGFVVET